MQAVDTKNKPEAAAETAAKGSIASAQSKRPSGLTDLPEAATRDISAALKGLLADTFALYLKTKNFHWHMSGPHFRDYHLLLDEQARTDLRDDRSDRRAGAQDRRHTLRSIGHIARHAAHRRQRCRLRRSAGHARRAARRQLRAGPACARRTTSCEGHGDIATSQPDRELDRRDRAAHLVPL